MEGYVWVFPKKRKMFDSRHILTPQCLHFLYCHGRLLGGGPSVAFIKRRQGSSVKLHSLSCIVLHRDRAPSLLKRIPQKVPEVLPTPHQSQSPKEKNSSDLQIFFVNKLLKPTVAWSLFDQLCLQKPNSFLWVFQQSLLSEFIIITVLWGIWQLPFLQNGALLVGSRSKYSPLLFLADLSRLLFFAHQEKKRNCLAEVFVCVA